jgi:hypothetical protein
VTARRHEIRSLLDRVHSIAPPMPADDDPDRQWEDWMSLHELQSILAGCTSILLSGGQVSDRTRLTDARHLLDRSGVRALVGARLPDHLRLIDLITEAR